MTLMTIVFTSGSTGTPKGVMLSHENIGTNMDGIERCASFRPTDAMIGILPFFHSFGYTATLWAAIGCNLRGIYHFSPLDARQVGKLVERFKGTILVATPTFLRSYLRRCTAEQFESLDVVVAGAERLRWSLFNSFRRSLVFALSRATERPSCHRLSRSTYRTLVSPILSNWIKKRNRGSAHPELHRQSR